MKTALAVLSVFCIGATVSAQNCPSGVCPAKRGFGFPLLASAAIRTVTRTVTRMTPVSAGCVGVARTGCAGVSRAGCFGTRSGCHGGTFCVVTLQVAPAPAAKPMPAGPPAKPAPAPAPQAAPCPCGGVAAVALVQTQEPLFARRPVRSLLERLLAPVRAVANRGRCAVHREAHRIVDR